MIKSIKSNMADDDEVDVLGDFNLDNLFSKEDGRLASCYDGSVLGSQGAELLHCDYNIGPHWLLDPTTQPCWYGTSEGFPGAGTDSLPTPSHWGESDSWTDKEKSLLEKGLELFGRSWVRLAQFIGSKSSQQVKSYVSTHHQQHHFDSGALSFTELIDDMQIPASMEEVIAVVSTAQPTIPPVPRRHIASSSSLATRESADPGPQDQPRSKGRRGRPQLAKNNKRVRKAYVRPGKKGKMECKPSAVLVMSSGEEVVRIKKESSVDSDDDEEIEIEENVDVANRSEASHHCVTTEREPEVVAIEEPKSMPSEEEEEEEDEEVKQESSDAGAGSSSHHDVLESIYNLPVPNEELQLDPNVITEEERAIHAEFFEGRSTKTPKRYLKIRNHILECWKQCHPSYVTKTSVRTGLKNCGDVNCIGRIHAYLEQIGAINFGCDQARYLRPLYLAPVCASPLSVQSREKASKEQLAARQQARINAMRPRKKKQDTWFCLDGDGGYTITHSADGEAIHTTVVQDTAGRASRARPTKADPLKLIYCNKFSDTKPAPFSVLLRVGALLVMDVHAHSSQSEVAGLLGGSFECGTLHVIQAVACRSSSSGMHCDMCPVSQTEATERLQAAGLEVVGWYHSHPTFLPNPSIQDLTTQASMQHWFTQTATSPIVGIIMSPYCPTSCSLASQYRCLTVEPCGAPYRFPVALTSDGINVATLLSHIADVFKLVEENRTVAIDFAGEFQPAITYMQKCVESVRLHLQACGGVPEEQRAAVLQGIHHACRTLMLLD